MATMMSTERPVPPDVWAPSSPFTSWADRVGTRPTSCLMQTHGPSSNSYLRCACVRFQQLNRVGSNAFLESNSDSGSAVPDWYVPILSAGANDLPAPLPCAHFFAHLCSANLFAGFLCRIIEASRNEYEEPFHRDSRCLCGPGWTRDWYGSFARQSSAFSIPCISRP